MPSFHRNFRFGFRWRARTALLMTLIWPSLVQWLIRFMKYCSYIGVTNPRINNSRSERTRSKPLEYFTVCFRGRTKCSNTSDEFSSVMSNCLMVLYCFMLMRDFWPLKPFTSLLWWLLLCSIDSASRFRNRSAGTQNLCRAGSWCSRLYQTQEFLKGVKWFAEFKCHGWFSV